MGVRHVRKDLTGQRFGKLVALSFVRHKTKGSNNQSQWLCRCDCGKEKPIFRGALINGKSTSCGCNTRTANGDASRGSIAPEYSTWLGMRKRCTDSKSKAWPHYGGRGIKVCERWENDYQKFLSDVGRRPTPKHSIDRIDVNGNYEPGNVRWATREQQIGNRRPFQRKGWRQAVKHAWAVVKDFESVIASYTGARYAVAVDSCTNALLIACAHHKVGVVQLPKHTYVGVACSVINAGGRIKFVDSHWTGMYQMLPYPIYDAARNFTSGMYIPGTLMCLSFHWTKHLGLGRGGAILCDDKDVAESLKRYRFDGRTEGVAPKNEKFAHIGWHVPMSPTVAAQGLLMMAGMKEHNDPLPWGPGTNSDYPDLSQMECFK